SERPRTRAAGQTRGRVRRTTDARRTAAVHHLPPELHGSGDSSAGWWRDMRRPLEVGAFRHVAAAFTINELGNWLGEIALAVVVFDRTHSPLLTAALFLCARFLPALIGPALTARLEHLRGTRVLPALHLGEALVFAALA